MKLKHLLLETAPISQHMYDAAGGARKVNETLTDLGFRRSPRTFAIEALLEAPAVTVTSALLCHLSRLNRATFSQNSCRYTSIVGAFRITSVVALGA